MARITASRARSQTIGAVSERTGVNIETIRYYERIKLLPSPLRTKGGQRVYGDDDGRRLIFIRRARELGFGIKDIRGLLALVDRKAATCGEVQSVTERQLSDVRAKIADLRRLEKMLAGMTAACAGGEIPECPILEILFAPTPGGQPTSAGLRGGKSSQS